ncbi:MAG: hypothetical protein DBW62_00640 [Microbacterium sp.]|nr:MAG: hypothetical protein DBW62_00640 [Microbacterium sp.]
MPDDFQVDASDLNVLSADLGAAPRNAAPFLRSALEYSARELRDDARQNARGMEHAPAFPFSITYDVKTLRAFGVTVMEAEVGPDKDRPQGALGNLIEYGSVNNPPQGILHGALQRVEPDFESGIDKATADALRASGLL